MCGWDNKILTWELLFSVNIFILQYEVIYYKNNDKGTLMLMMMIFLPSVFLFLAKLILI